MTKPYFVYVYYDPRYTYKAKTIINCKHLPVYVGKGKGNRHLTHLNKAKNIFLRKYIEQMKDDGVEPIIEKVAFFDNEKEAYKYEYSIIVDFGIIYDLSGSLFNKARGNQMFISYDRDYRNTLLKEYRKMITSDQNVKLISTKKITLTEAPEVLHVLEKQIEIDLTLNHLMKEKLKEYIKIGWTIKECCSIFKITEEHIRKNVSELFLNKWIV